MKMMQIIIVMLIMLHYIIEEPSQNKDWTWGGVCGSIEESNMEPNKDKNCWQRRKWYNLI